MAGTTCPPAPPPATTAGGPPRGGAAPPPPFPPPLRPPLAFLARLCRLPFCFWLAGARPPWTTRSLPAPVVEPRAALAEPPRATLRIRPTANRVAIRELLP